MGAYWCQVRDGNPVGFALYRRHYSAKKNPRPKRNRFVGPGQRMVLIGEDEKALFVWRKFIDDSGQVGVNCAVFRNEGSRLSSELIRQAVELAWVKWPGERLYTTVDAKETAGRRGKLNPPGYCFRVAGWVECGKTKKKGLVILELQPPTNGGCTDGNAEDEGAADAGKAGRRGAGGE